MLTAACVQLSSTHHLDHNIARASVWIREAAARGAQMIALPENVAFMGETPDAVRAHAFFMEEHPALQAFSLLARELAVWILIGSLAVRVTDQERLANRSIWLASDGSIAAYYDKIHLFDVTLSTGESHRESARFFPGAEAVLVPSPFGMLGMSVCYDVRFPDLYRRLAQRGAQIFTVPAAFTHTTGSAHWHVLLRARAIETFSFVIAPAQCGVHPSGRRTFGHSMIIDPNGVVLSEALEDEEGVILASLDVALSTQMRKAIPSLGL